VYVLHILASSITSSKVIVKNTKNPEITTKEIFEERFYAQITIRFSCDFELLVHVRTARMQIPSCDLKNLLILS
jgi:hypothetical protein